jgi:uncharacterized iron-regulated membrane protein
MPSPRAVRAWCAIHTWSSLVCTVFLLMLCLTGLPLIFHDEIDHLLGHDVAAPEMAADAPRADLDRIVDAAIARHPGEVMKFIYWDADEPDSVSLTLAPTRDAPPADARNVIVDARTAAVLGEPQHRARLTHFLLVLHMELFAGLPGKLFLGLIGIIFVAAIVSGIVVYGPFMRRIDFGTVRTDKSRRLKWLDLHNLIGIVTVSWALVVGVTGIINTLTDPLVKFWQYKVVMQMAAANKGRPVATTLSPVGPAVEVARGAAPGMTPTLVAYPGTGFSTPRHYSVFMRGATPLTAQLRTPVLVDAETGELAAVLTMPWYITVLRLSQPLHFGDYGGMPLKILWALLDCVTIVVLASGLYLWIARRRTSVAPGEAPLFAPESQGTI